jgi:nitrate/nitrite-specific signal transduction histidine kinase
MPSGDDPVQKSQEFFGVFLKAKEFTEELLKENERLRFKIAKLESNQGAALPDSPDAQVRDLTQRVRELEAHLQEIEQSYRKVEEENKEFADRYIEIEEQNNNLANLYVASYQLHSTLDYREVIRIVQEIVINLIGAEAFHIFVISDKTGQLELETSEGTSAPVTSIALGEGPIGQAAKTGENYFADTVAHREATPFDQPTAVIPLKIKESVIGVISINKLLVQKTSFTTMDYELFTLLAGHAATAIFSAKLYSTSARKLTTLQGFLDMIKTPAKS